MALRRIIIGLPLIASVFADTCPTVAANNQAYVYDDSDGQQPLDASGRALNCGTYGKLRKTSSITTLPSCSAADTDACAAACAVTDGCVSFGWTEASTTCHLYNKRMVQMGYVKKATNLRTVFYNGRCYRTREALVQDPSFDQADPAGESTYWTTTSDGQTQQQIMYGQQYQHDGTVA